MKIKKGDIVKIISGDKKRKGRIGKVLSVNCIKKRVTIDGVAKIKKHLKPQKHSRYPDGGIIDDLGSIHLSNVMLMSESQSRPVRYGVKLNKDGKRIRVARGKNVKEEVI